MEVGGAKWRWVAQSGGGWRKVEVGGAKWRWVVQSGGGWRKWGGWRKVEVGCAKCAKWGWVYSTATVNETLTTVALQ